MTAPPARSAVLVGLGTALPSRLVGNAEIAPGIGVDPQWIVERTGIRSRHRAAPGTTTADLACAAGAGALASAGITDVDAVVLATTTPDGPCPAGAPEVATRLGLTDAAAHDVAAVCSGFLYGLASGAGAIAAGVADRVLVIAAELYSRIVDPADRDTSAVFGDGAGAVVLAAGTPGGPGRILGLDLGSDGTGHDLIVVGPCGRLAMEGREVFVHAVRRMADSAATALARSGWTAADVDVLVAHQANLRILQAVADRLGIERERCAVHLDRVGNTSAASVPLACADAVRSGRLAAGDRVLLTAFGGGLTWGSAALEWPDIGPHDHIGG